MGLLSLCYTVLVFRLCCRRCSVNYQSLLPSAYVSPPFLHGPHNDWSLLHTVPHCWKGFEKQEASSGAEGQREEIEIGPWNQLWPSTSEGESVDGRLGEGILTSAKSYDSCTKRAAAPKGDTTATNQEIRRLTRPDPTVAYATPPHLGMGVVAKDRPSDVKMRRLNDQDSYEL